MTQMTRNEILEKVRARLVYLSGKEFVTEAMKLEEDLGFDSLDILGAGMNLEADFEGIRVADHMLTHWVTVKDVVDTLVDLLAQEPA